LSVVLLSVVGSGIAFAADLHGGKPISAADASAWDIEVGPDGAGLPTGSGTSAQGANIFVEQCSACHGEGGRGAVTTTSGAPSAPPVVSFVKRNGTDDTTLTIANFWPYATTLFGYTRRAMPFQESKSLTSDEVYAVSAYILNLNGIVGSNDVIDAQSLPKVRMPNRDGFIPFPRNPK